MESDVDWSAVTARLGDHPPMADLGAAVLNAAAGPYVASVEDCCLLEFTQAGATFLFDQAGASSGSQADRSVAAWTLTPDHVLPRNVGYQRRFPLGDAADGRARDRGHLIPHLSGGTFGPNIFPQDRALNRGWSEAGKRYRAIERHAAAAAGTFFFGRLIYSDDTDEPHWVEIGSWIDGALKAERFANRGQLD